MTREHENGPSAPARALLRLGWEMRSLAGKSPGVFLPIARRRYRPGQFEIPIGPDTELVIEGFPRTGSTFAFTAFELAQPRGVVVAHHSHVPAQVIAAVRRGLPAIVLVRAPEETALSLVVRLPYLSLEQALRSYVRFYRALLPHAPGFVVAPFEEVIHNLGAVIRRLNDRFGTAFAEFVHTRQNLERCMAVIEEGDRRNWGRGIEFERAVGRPSEVRERLKDQLRDRYRSGRLRAARVRAEGTYRMFLRAEASRP